MKITDYGTLSSTQPDDVLPIVDVHDFTQAGTGSTKKITVANLLATVAQIDATTGDIAASPGTAAAGAVGKAADAGHVHPSPTAFAPAGLTGATAASRYVGATATGAPSTGTFVVGDFVVDQTGKVWVCTAAGSPGTWANTSGSGLVNPMTGVGDTIYGSTGGAASRLAPNTSTTKNFLTQTGTGTAGQAPAWGTIAAADVPTLNQNTTGTASNVTGTVAIANGGTGQTTQQAALDAVAGATTNNQVLAGNGTHVTLRALAAADLPAATTGAQGAVQLDNTATDIKAPGTQAAGSSTLVPKADHVHPASFTATGYVAPAVVTLTDAATITVDASQGNVFRVTLGGNRTLGNPTNLIDGMPLWFEVKQDATGSRTLSLGTNYEAPTGLAFPTLTTTAGKVDILGFRYSSFIGKVVFVGYVLGA